MDHLNALPNEILHHVFTEVEVCDLAALLATCRKIRTFVRTDSTLFREVYLRFLDDPCMKDDNKEFNWEEELHEYVRTKRVLDYQTVEEKLPHLPYIASRITSLTQTASSECPPQDSLNLSLLSDYFAQRPDNNNVEALLCQSITFNRASITRASMHPRVSSAQPIVPRPLLDFKSRQAAAKLHVLNGVPIENWPPGSPQRSRFSSAYPYACSMVYDLRNYTPGTGWGPYLDDEWDGIEQEGEIVSRSRGRVDWEKMEAVMIVIAHNVRLFSASSQGVFRPHWTIPWKGCTPGTYKGISLKDVIVEDEDDEKPEDKEDNSNAAGNGVDGKIPPPLDDVRSKDPYNVSGTWLRIVCFLDFHELHHYNFNNNDPGPGNPRPPIDTQEAIRLIVMEITAKRIAAPGPNDDPSMPVVWFEGTSRSMHGSWDPNATSNIRGRVSKTLDGEIRWTSWSIYWGEERWKNEAIQVGGLGSARGCLGYWFDKNMSDEGPAGPTAYWKVSDDIEPTKLNETVGDGSVDEEDDEDEEHDEDFEDEDEDDDGNAVMELDLGDMQTVLPAVLSALAQQLQAGHTHHHHHNHHHHHHHHLHNHDHDHDHDHDHEHTD